MKKWSFDADYLQSCNCDYGCPCEFSAPPSPGFCEGMGVWRIDQGEYDGLSLKGTGLAFAAKWPGAIHEGNGTVRVRHAPTRTACSALAARRNASASGCLKCRWPTC